MIPSKKNSINRKNILKLEMFLLTFYKMIIFLAIISTLSIPVLAKPLSIAEMEKVMWKATEKAIADMDLNSEQVKGIRGLILGSWVNKTGGPGSDIDITFGHPNPRIEKKLVDKINENIATMTQGREHHINVMRKKDFLNDEFYRGPTGQKLVYDLANETADGTGCVKFNVTADKSGKKIIQRQRELTSHYWSDLGDTVPEKIVRPHTFFEDNVHFIKKHLDDLADIDQKATMVAKYVNRTDDMIIPGLQSQWKTNLQNLRLNTTDKEIGRILLENKKIADPMKRQLKNFQDLKKFDKTIDSIEKMNARLSKFVDDGQKHMMKLADDVQVVDWAVRMNKLKVSGNASRLLKVRDKIWGIMKKHAHKLFSVADAYTVLSAYYNADPNLGPNAGLNAAALELSTIGIGYACPPAILSAMVADLGRQVFVSVGTWAGQKYIFDPINNNALKKVYDPTEPCYIFSMPNTIFTSRPGKVRTRDNLSCYLKSSHIPARVRQYVNEAKAQGSRCALYTTAGAGKFQPILEKRMREDLKKSKKLYEDIVLKRSLQALAGTTTPPVIPLYIQVDSDEQMIQTNRTAVFNVKIMRNFGVTEKMKEGAKNLNIAWCEDAGDLASLEKYRKENSETVYDSGLTDMDMTITVHGAKGWHLSGDWPIELPILDNAGNGISKGKLEIHNILSLLQAHVLRKFKLELSPGKEATETAKVQISIIWHPAKKNTIKSKIYNFTMTAHHERKKHTDSNSTMQSKIEKKVVTISILDELDNTPLKGVSVTIISPDGNLSRYTTAAGKVKVLLPPKSDFTFEFYKTGYKKKVISQKGIDSETLQFKLSPTANNFTHTPEKQLKFKINPTELLMKTGEKRYISATSLSMKGPVMIPKNVTADVTWKPMDPKLISVNKGVVQSIGGTGKTTIEASYSIDPNKPPMIAVCKVRIMAKGPDIPRVHIKLVPDKPYYKAGSGVSMYAIPEKFGPWEYKWYIGSKELPGERIHYTFDKPGTYTIAVVTRSTVDGKEDRISKFIEVREDKPIFDDAKIMISPTPPYTPPANLEIVLKGAEGEWIQWKVNGKDVKKGQGKWVYTFKEKGSYTIKAELIDTLPKKTFSKTITLDRKVISPPHASHRNRFDKVIKNGDLEIRSSYWKEGKTGLDAAWSKARSFDHIGYIESAIITTGNQADLYNTGWLVYVPKGKNKVHFKVYGFNFKTEKGRTIYSGSFDLHGKTVVPKSLVFTDVTPYSATVEWRGDDGSLGRVNISKRSSNSDSYVHGGIKELAFTEPRKPIKEKPLANFEKIAPGVFIYKDKEQRLTVRIESPCEHVVFESKVLAAAGKRAVITRFGEYGFDNIRKRRKYGHYGIFILDRGTFQLPYPSKADSTKNKIMAIRYYLWYKLKNKEGLLLAYVNTVPPGNTLDKRPLQKIDGLTIENVPISDEAVYKSSRWPVRLQDGILEIQGERQGHYSWYKNWINLGNNIDDFQTVGTSIGPLVVMKSGSHWSVVLLDYASGTIRKKYSSSQPISIRHRGKYGAVLEIGERCYDFTPNQESMREVNCRTFMYTGASIN